MSEKLTPLEERLRRIDKAIEKEDWFSGFTNAITYFEHYGYLALRAHCVRENVELTSKAMKSLKSLGAANIALSLFILKIIDEETYSSLKKIIEERNNLVHPGRRGIRYRDEKKKESAIRLLNKAKEHIQKIQITIKVRRRNKP